MFCTNTQSKFDSVVFDLLGTPSLQPYTFQYPDRCKLGRKETEKWASGQTLVNIYRLETAESKQC